jgi:hypothetical protein
VKSLASAIEVTGVTVHQMVAATRLDAKLDKPIVDSNYTPSTLATPEARYPFTAWLRIGLVRRSVLKP